MKELLYFTVLSVLAKLVSGASPTAAPSLLRSTLNSIQTYAGTGSGTTSGTGGPALSAGFAGPRTVIPDTAGNYYIAESFANCVRKISPSNIITAYLGTCATTFGASGDNGPASSALIYFPVHMLFDSVGAFYVTDFKNYKVRYVSTSGIVSTIAGTGGGVATNGMGGAATSADLLAPHALWMSSTNQIYISLYQDATIKVFTKGGTISSVAGRLRLLFVFCKCNLLFL